MAEAPGLVTLGNLPVLGIPAAAAVVSVRGSLRAGAVEVLPIAPTSLARRPLMSRPRGWWMRQQPGMHGGMDKNG